MKEQHLELETVVTECCGYRYRCVAEGGHQVLATLGGKLLKHRIRVTLGDSVTLAVSPYDLARGIITHRHK